jgi:hypothetical protein
MFNIRIIKGRCKKMQELLFIFMKKCYNKIDFGGNIHEK